MFNPATESRQRLPHLLPSGAKRKLSHRTVDVQPIQERTPPLFEVVLLLRAAASR